MALLANIHRDPRKSSQLITPDKFNPWTNRKAGSKPLVKMSIKALKGLFVRGHNEKG